MRGKPPKGGTTNNKMLHSVASTAEGDAFQCDTYLGDDGGLKLDFRHSPAAPAERKKLLGAYCLIWVKDQPMPTYVWVDFGAVNKNQGNWKTMPGWMTRKCAIAAGLREAFANDFRGAYIEEELGATQHHSTQPMLNPKLVTVGPSVPVDLEPKKPKSKPKKAKATKPPKPEPKPEPVIEVEAEVVEEPAPEPEPAPVEPAKQTAEQMITKDDVRDWLKPFAAEFGIKMVLARHDNITDLITDCNSLYKAQPGYVTDPWGIGEK